MLYTVGHSNLDWPAFLDLTADLDILVDIRSHPGSHWPQFQQESMTACLGDRYQWWPGLGGWTAAHLHLQAQFPQVDIAAYAHRKFPKHHIAANTTNPTGPVWTNQGLLDYAYYMFTDHFIQDAERLLALAGTYDVGICCGEALYYKCHRSMISDYAMFKGCDSIHLIGRSTKTKGYKITKTHHSEVIGNRLDRYPEGAIKLWQMMDLR